MAQVCRVKAEGVAQVYAARVKSEGVAQVYACRVKSEGVAQVLYGPADGLQVLIRVQQCA